LCPCCIGKDDAEQAALAKKLATILLDAPLKIDPKDLLLENIDFESLAKVFADLNFNSLLKRLGELGKIAKVKEETRQKEEAKVKDKQMSLL
jgi:DNA polymerase-1